MDFQMKEFYVFICCKKALYQISVIIFSNFFFILIYNVQYIALYMFYLHKTETYPTT